MSAAVIVWGRFRGIFGIWIDEAASCSTTPSNCAQRKNERSAERCAAMVRGA